MSYTKPSTVVLQIRPDQVLKSIDVNPKNEKTNKFSNRQYFGQLFHPGNSLVLVIINSKHSNAIKRDKNISLQTSSI